MQVDRKNLTLVLTLGIANDVKAGALMNAFKGSETFEGHKFWDIQYRRLRKGRPVTLKAQAALNKLEKEATNATE